MRPRLNNTKAPEEMTMGEISELAELLNRCPYMWEDIKSVLKKEKPVTCLQKYEAQP